MVFLVIFPMGFLVVFPVVFRMVFLVVFPLAFPTAFKTAKFSEGVEDLSSRIRAPLEDAWEDRFRQGGKIQGKISWKIVLLPRPPPQDAEDVTTIRRGPLSAVQAGLLLADRGEPEVQTLPGRDGREDEPRRGGESGQVGGPAQGRD